MKKLSDYKNDEAIELWGDLLEPFTAIITNKKVKEAIQNKTILEVARIILKENKKEAIEILLRIDSTPLDGTNIILRLLALLADIGQNENVKTFFGFAEQKTDNTSFGSVMGNTQE